MQIAPVALPIWAIATVLTADNGFTNRHGEIDAIEFPAATCEAQAQMSMLASVSNEKGIINITKAGFISGYDPVEDEEDHLREFELQFPEGEGLYEAETGHFLGKLSATHFSYRFANTFISQVFYLGDVHMAAVKLDGTFYKFSLSLLRHTITVDGKLMDMDKYLAGFSRLMPAVVDVVPEHCMAFRNALYGRGVVSMSVCKDIEHAKDVLETWLTMAGCLLVSEDEIRDAIEDEDPNRYPEGEGWYDHNGAYLGKAGDTSYPVGDRSYRIIDVVVRPMDEHELDDSEYSEGAMLILSDNPYIRYECEKLVYVMAR